MAPNVDFSQKNFKIHLFWALWNIDVFGRGRAKKSINLKKLGVLILFFKLNIHEHRRRAHVGRHGLSVY